MIAFPDISPTLFEIDIGPVQLAIRWYALAYIAGIVLGWKLFAATLKRPRLWPERGPPLTVEQLDEFITWLILGIIIGGRLGFCLVYQREYYLEHPWEILRVWEGGMAFHGGFAGVVVAAAIFAWRHRIGSWLSFADGLALGTPPGLLFGRIANFINAELWGRPTDAPWGVVFPGAAAQDCPGVVGPCARHPSQLYEAGLEGLLLGAVLTFLAFAGGFRRPGLILGIFLLGYAAARSFAELYRVADAQFVTPDSPLGRVAEIAGLEMSMGQLLSLPMAVIGAGFIVAAVVRGRQ